MEKTSVDYGHIFDTVGMQVVGWMGECEQHEDAEDRKRFLCVALIHAAVLLARLHLSEEVAAQEISKMVNHALMRLSKAPDLG